LTVERYCRPRGAFIDSYTDRSARAVSDHLPVIADVSLNGAVPRGATSPP